MELEIFNPTQSTCNSPTTSETLSDPTYNTVHKISFIPNISMSPLLNCDLKETLDNYDSMSSQGPIFPLTSVPCIPSMIDSQSISIEGLQILQSNHVNYNPSLTITYSKLTDPVTIKQICHDKVPGWGLLRPEDVKVEQIMAGLTNQLFHVQICPNTTRSLSTSLRHKRILFRIHGENSCNFYSSKFEMEVFKYLGTIKIAPKLIGQFKGGRIEEWIYGLPLKVEDLLNPSTSCSVASILGRFHRMHEDQPDFPFKQNAGPSSFHKAVNWIASGLLNKKYQEINIYEHISAIDLYQFEQEAYGLEEFTLKQFSISTPATNIVFCHNDVQENNIMRSESSLKLIDFEYTDFNYAAFDLANFFIEATIDYTYKKHPFYSINLENYPCEELRKLFAAVYLSVINKKPILPSSPCIIPFLQQVEWFRLSCNLFWCYWSIISSPSTSTFDEFDYKLYAKDRFDMYWKIKKELMGFANCT